MSELQERGEAILGAALSTAQQRWGQRLLAAYALGSLAHGGFSAASDVDMGIVLDDPVGDADSDGIAALAASIKSSKRPLADRLSIFWGTLATLSGTATGGRFPPLDRLDLIKYGRLMAGTDIRSRLPLPTRKELVLAGAEFAIWRLCTDEVIERLKNPAALARCDSKTLTKLILFPVRFMFTAQTGEVGRNEAAVEHFVANVPGPPSALARLALEWRNAQDWSADENAVSAIAAGMLPLYRTFLADHEKRMLEYGRRDLAQAFRKWQRNLE